MAEKREKKRDFSQPIISRKKRDATLWRGRGGTHTEEWKDNSVVQSLKGKKEERRRRDTHSGQYPSITPGKKEWGGKIGGKEEDSFMSLFPEKREGCTPSRQDGGGSGSKEEKGKKKEGEMVAGP